MSNSATFIAKKSTGITFLLGKVTNKGTLAPVFVPPPEKEVMCLVTGDKGTLNFVTTSESIIEISEPVSKRKLQLKFNTLETTLSETIGFMDFSQL